MKNLIPCDKPTIAALADRLKRATRHPEYQRIECVLIRATLFHFQIIRALCRLR